MTYELLAKTSIVFPWTPGDFGSDPSAGGQASPLILPDGSIFLACYVIATPMNVIRLWRYSPQLELLGTSDIPCPLNPNGQYINLQAVSASGMNVLLLVVHDLHTTGSYSQANAQDVYSRIIDCSGTDPIAGPETKLNTGFPQPTPFTGYPGINYENWGYGGTIVVLDPANDKVIVTVRGMTAGGVGNRMALQVFRISTGAFLSQAESPPGLSGNEVSVGLNMDATDKTQFTLASSHSIDYHFTVSLDGSSSAFVGSSPFAEATNNSWLLAVGSSGFLAQLELTPWPDYTYALAYCDPVDGTILSSRAEVPILDGVTVMDSRQVNLNGSMTTLLSGRHLLLTIETVHGVIATPSYYLFGMQLVGVDQLTAPPTIELLDLDYFDPWSDPLSTTLRSPNDDTSELFDGRQGITADQATGIIIVTAEVFSQARNYSTVMIWKIQGPTGTPNLAGDLLNDRVRFTGLPS